MESSWRSKRWQWLAYAFFSKRVCSSLEVLALKRIEHVGTEEIEAFYAILSSDNPEAVLLGCPNGLASIQDATLAANSPIRWDFDEQGQPVLSSDVLKSASPIPFLRILSESKESEWVDVIVPGYGRCQVQRENVVLSELVDIRPGNNLKALKIHFDTNLSMFSLQTVDISGMPLFFAAVGSSLKSLTVDTGDVYILVDVKMVFERCPNLEKLCLKRQDVAVLDFSEYHTAGSPLPAITINLDDVPALTKELMNTESDLSHCLQRLTIHQAYRWDINPELDQMLKALLMMLESNGRLEFLCVHMYRYEEECLTKQFRKFHLQTINQSAKLDAQSKIAFLSVLLKTSVSQKETRKRDHQPGNKRVNWEALDANVVINIFQFAAAPVLRKVYVKMFK